MAVNLKYPIVYDGDYFGKITFEAMIEPPVAANLFSSGRASSEPNTPIEAHSAFYGTAAVQTPIRPGAGGVVSDGKVSLFLPQAIQISDGANYDNINLGAVGAIAANALATGSSVFGAIARGTTKDIETFISTMIRGGNSDVARLAAMRVTENTLSTELQGAVRTNLQVIANPNARTLFRSVPVRQFNFAFKLIPNSAEESRAITEIIRFFRTQLYPDTIGPSVGGVLGLKFPNKFEIKMLYRDREIGTKFLPSYLTSFTSTYNATGGAMHSNGEWTDVEIMTSFTEVRSMTKADVNAGY